MSMGRNGQVVILQNSTDRALFPESATSNRTATVHLDVKGLIGRAQEEARKKLLHSIIDSEARARCRRLDRMLICSGTDCISGSSKSTKY